MAENNSRFRGVSSRKPAAAGSKTPAAESRSLQEPRASAPQQASNRPVGEGDHDTLARFQALDEKARRLNEMRMRQQFQRETAEKDLKRLQGQAEEIGAKTPEELEALCNEMEEADRQALDEWARQLEAEERLLSEIESKLQELAQENED